MACDQSTSVEFSIVWMSAEDQDAMSHDVRLSDLGRSGILPVSSMETTALCTTASR
jgi:hypothetical protein